MDITSYENDRFVLNDHQTLDRNADLVCAAASRFAEGRMSKVRFTELKNAAGLSATSYGLLADPDIREAISILDVIVIDWLHTFFQEGVMSIEMFEVLNSCLGLQLSRSRERIQGFLKSCAFP